MAIGQPINNIFKSHEVLMKALTDRKHRVVLNACHLQILDHALDLGVSNIRTVNMANQIQQRQHGDQTKIHLPEDLLSTVLREVDVELLVVGSQADDAERVNLRDMRWLRRKGLDVRRLVGYLDIILAVGSGTHGCEMIGVNLTMKLIFPIKSMKLTKHSGDVS